MNPDLDRLQPYPFEKLTALLEGLQTPADIKMISLAVGEPQHPVPEVVLEALRKHMSSIGSYPATRGEDQLREVIAAWIEKRFAPARINPATQVLPVNGTREALFAIAQAVVDRGRPARVAMPNPGYQIYEGAALLAGARPLYLDCNAGNGYLPDFDSIDPDTWRQVQLLYLCSPGNPTGSVLPTDQLQQAIALAEQHDFVIAGDECYSEIYADDGAPPPGLLQAAAEMGNTGLKRCLVFHSLSKRSNVPGLRSGFVAGDAELIAQFLRYRTYHGCAMNPAVQQASIAAWSDETHVSDNRARYREKFAKVLPILQPAVEVQSPMASFYLWPQLADGDDETAAQRLWSDTHLRCLPGRYLGRDAGDGNPGAGHLRLSLVPAPDDCVEAAQRIVRVLAN